LAISSTGLDKGILTPAHFLEIDGTPNVIRGGGRPSTETFVHLAIVRCVNAGAVLHTHSVWSTVLSCLYASRGGVILEGYEMLKGLTGVRTHEHRELLPILDNSQNTIELAEKVWTILRKHSGLHGFLLRGHGLYTWGASLQEAKRHIEILEWKCLSDLPNIWSWRGSTEGTHAMAILQIPGENRSLRQHDEIRDFLAGIGIDYERWEPVAGVTPEASSRNRLIISSAVVDM
jgi:methylthioribulose-1-phosphate dehydratase